RTSEIRRLWNPPCEFEKRSLTLHSGASLRGLNAAVYEAFQALDSVMRTFSYVPRANSSDAWETGAYNCRKITNGPGYSLHAYGIAADINARTNPYGKRLVTDMPLAMVVAIKAIETTAGLGVFRWGGDYRSVKDAMHYEVVLSPAELSAGIDWDTVVAEPPDRNDPRTWPTLRNGDKGPTVKRLNEMLGGAGFDTPNSATFSSKTRAAVRSYQESRKLTVDGIVGLQTWTALLNDMPAVSASESSPFKVESIPLPERPLVKSGDESPVVEELQRHLVDEAFDPGEIDGVFGANTKAMVVAFQKANGLDHDGVAGPQTWRALLT
ncbi:MAG TPA: peptidoglycan-binding protein, partial [Acidimicrobiia bacterium]